MDLEGKNGTYSVGNLVAKNDRYRLRMCFDEDGRELMLQAARDYVAYLQGLGLCLVGTIGCYKIKNSSQ